MFLPSIGCDLRYVFVRRVWVTPRLPGIRVVLYGPRWERHVRRRLVAEVDPASARYHWPGRRLRCYDIEPDVRERVVEELRPGIVAQWADPLERIGAKGVLHRCGVKGRR